jgi:hypothetical protein
LAALVNRYYTDWRTVPDDPLRVGDPEEPEELDEDDVPPRPERLLEDDEDYWKKAITYTKEEDMYVENEVPIPANRRATKYPFANMGIGQSVHFPGQSTNGKAYKAAMAMGGRRGWNFMARRENDGLRIWRKE